MTRVIPPKSRCTVTKENGDVKIVIPARKNFLLLAFVGFWLLGWAFGEVAVIAQLLTNEGQGSSGSSAFTLAWLGAWTIGGGFVIYTWLWNLSGREVVTANRKHLRIDRMLLGFKRSQEFDAKEIGDLKAASSESNPWGAQSGTRFWGLPGTGPISFAYGAKTYRFGSGLDDAEAEGIIATVSEAMKVAGW